MARYFLDSSALAKRYHAEIGTPVVDALFADAGNQLLASRLAIVEVHSSFARRFREGILSSVELTELIEMLEADVATGLITIVAVTNRRLDDASILLRTHGLNLNVRTLDAIHLATAQAFSIASPATIFAAADKKLLAVASAACGLTMLDVG